MELYRGTMMHYSAILYRDDEACEDMAISFERRGWLGYALRLPETICVDERVPPGRRPVLINPSTPIQTSTCRSRQRRSGRRGYRRQALDRLAGEDRAPAGFRSRAVQAPLQHDQIVFDASRKAAR